MKSASTMLRDAKRRDQREQAQRQELQRERRARREARAARPRVAARLMGMRLMPHRRLLRTVRRNWMLPRRVRLKLALRRWEAFNALATGKWETRHGQILAGVSNISQVLCEWGIGPENEAHVLVAQKALAAVGDGKYTFDRCPLDSAGLEAVSLLLEIHDAQLESDCCTNGVMAAADKEIKRRIQEGNIVGKVPAAPAPVKLKDGSLKPVSDLGPTERMVTDALRDLRALTKPVDDSPVDQALVSLETFAAVALEVMKRSTPAVVRECTRLVAQQCRDAAAAQQQQEQRKAA